MRRFLVTSFLADVTQQIHSLRASGVIAAHRPFAAASDSMALRKSDGSLWTAPPAIALVVMRQYAVPLAAQGVGRIGHREVQRLETELANDLTGMGRVMHPHG
jgi:hypothetical protein